MKIFRAYKTELDPNNNQRAIFVRCCGASRYVYNWGLAEWKRQYENGEKPSRYGLCKQFNAQKDNICPWIRDLPYAVVESSFANLGTAFENFFRRIKNKATKTGYPKFKKRGVKNGFQVRNTKIDSNQVRLTGAGWIQLKERNYIPINVDKYGVYTTISERAGRWFISIMCEIDIPDPAPRLGNPLGVDVGIKSLAVLSDGTVFENPRALDQMQRKLKCLQRELARRKTGSQNRNKTKAKIAKIYAKIVNVRQNATHNASHRIINHTDADTIVLENLNVSGMIKNHHIAQALTDASVSELHRQIDYKASWAGVEVIRADRFYPSSKTCSSCGSIKPQLSLSEREFVCSDCGIVIDRDLNAAINLAALSEPLNGRGLPRELECNNAPQ